MCRGGGTACVKFAKSLRFANTGFYSTQQCCSLNNLNIEQKHREHCSLNNSNVKQKHREYCTLNNLWTSSKNIRNIAPWTIWTLNKNIENIAPWTLFEHRAKTLALLLISLGSTSSSDPKLEHRYALVMLEHRYVCNTPVILVLNCVRWHIFFVSADFFCLGTFAAALLQGRTNR